MDRILYLHIGYRKTGTSSIQKTLVKREKFLAKRYDLGVFYELPDSREKDEVATVNSWLSGFYEVGRCYDAWHSYKRELFKRAGQLPNQKVLLSSEQFTWFFDKEDIAEIKYLARKYFGTVFIIVYIRRQDQLLLSNHRQIGSTYDFPDYFHGTTNAFPDLSYDYSDYLNFDRNLSNWEEVFGKDRMLIGVFDKEFLKEGDVTLDFFHKLGIYRDGMSDFLRVNLSKGFQEVKIGHLLRKRLWFRPYLFGLMMSRLKTLSSNKKKLLPSRREARDLYERYRISNITLNHRLGWPYKNPSIFSDDFSMYPVEREDHWDEESASEAITQLIQTFDELPLSLILQKRIEARIKRAKKQGRSFFQSLKEGLEEYLSGIDRLLS